MLGNSFYFSLFRKYVAVFGTLFNNIRIHRTEGGSTYELKVPISYGPKEKTLARVEADPGLNRPVSIVLPRMSFEISGVQYDGDRKLASTMFKRQYDSNGGANSQYIPVPYDIHFTLSIMAKNSEDATKIVEQILPFFTPDFTPTIHLVPEMNIKMDVPIILERVNVEDTYEGDFEKRRAIVWTLDFLVKGYIFGPIDGPLGNGANRPVIKIANVNVRDYGSGSLQDTVSVTPGLTSNGEPTTVLSESIPYLDINSDDNFGFVVTIE